MAELDARTEQSVIEECIGRLVNTSAVDARVQRAGDLVVGTIRKREAIQASVVRLIAKLSKASNTGAATDSPATNITDRAEQPIIAQQGVVHIGADIEKTNVGGAEIVVIAMFVCLTLQALVLRLTAHKRCRTRITHANACAADARVRGRAKLAVVA